MKNDFLRILKNFPGRRELTRSTLGCFSEEEYYYIDFNKINTKLQTEEELIKIPKNEEIWFKFLTFMVVLNEKLEEEGRIPPTNDFLELKSQKVAERICDKFNRIFYGGENMILDVAAITPDELIEFAKRGETLL